MLRIEITIQNILLEADASRFRTAAVLPTALSNTDLDTRKPHPYPIRVRFTKQYRALASETNMYVNSILLHKFRCYQGVYQFFKGHGDEVMSIGLLTGLSIQSMNQLHRQHYMTISLTDNDHHMHTLDFNAI